MGESQRRVASGVTGTSVKSEGATGNATTASLNVIEAFVLIAACAGRTVFLQQEWAAW